MQPPHSGGNRGNQKAHGCARKLGATAVAVELPLTGFDADVDAVRQAIEAAGPNVVVAAHSYGGCVVSAAASGNPDVTRLFYVASFLTEHNEHPFTILADYHGELLEALVITDTGVGVDAARARDVFFGDRDDESAAQLAARLRQMPLTGMEMSLASASISASPASLPYRSSSPEGLRRFTRRVTPSTSR